MAGLQLTADALTRVQNKLEAFAEGLPDDEQLALALVLAAPGADEVSGYAANKTDPKKLLENALRGSGNALSLVGDVLQANMAAANGIFRAV